MSLESYLRKIAIFRKIEGEDLKKLSELFESKKYEAGTVLFKEKTPQTKAFIIAEGSLVRKKLNTETNEQVVINKLTKGNEVGFLHLQAEDPAFATLVAETDVTVFEITREKFDQAVTTNPKIGLAIVAGLAEQVRAQTKLIRSIQPERAEDTEKVKVVFYDTKKWTVDAFDAQKKALGFDWIDIKYVSQQLSSSSAFLAAGAQAVCCFVNDNVDAQVVKTLSELGVKLIAMRCAGFDRVDLNMAETLGISVVRVPAYSPYAVAEHAIALLMTLNRKLHKAYNRTREANFNLDGLLGVDLHGKTAGVIGTGKIGQCVVNIFLGFGCKVLCYDVFINKDLAATPNVTYVPLEQLLSESNFISIHAPLTPETKHMINADSLKKMKKDAIIINTSRGGLIDSKALVEALEKDEIAGAGLDVYEQEKDYFFQDKSIDDKMIEDEVLRKLLSLKNVIVTGHQAFFTSEAVNNIAKTTLENIKLWKEGKRGREHPNSVHT